MIRTARTGLPVPRFRTELLRAGETAIAIGSPLGLENTVTAGIVSGVGREIPGAAAEPRGLREPAGVMHAPLGHPHRAARPGTPTPL